MDSVLTLGLPILSQLLPDTVPTPLPKSLSQARQMSRNLVEDQTPEASKQEEDAEF
jgi:hypothetical protein